MGRLLHGFAVALLCVALAQAQQSWTLAVSNPVRYTTTFSYDGPQPLMFGPMNGTIFNVWRQDTTHASNRGVLNLKTSTDGGNTWTLYSGANFCQAGDAAGCLVGEVSNNVGNPTGGISFDGTTIILCFDQDIVGSGFVEADCMRSTDGGNSFSSPVKMNSTNPTVTTLTTGYSGPMVSIPSGTSSATCPNGCDIVVMQDATLIYRLIFTFDHGQSWTLGRTITGAVTDEEAFVWLGGDELIGFGRNNPGTTTPDSTKNLLIFHTLDMGQTWPLSTTTNIGPAFSDPPVGVTSSGGNCRPTTLSWGEVSPFLVKPNPALSDGSLILLVAERVQWASLAAVCNHDHLRAINFTPASAISNPNGFNYGQNLYTTLPTIPNGSVNFGYPTAVQLANGTVLIEYYNESSFAGAVQLYTITGQFACGGSVSCLMGNISGGMSIQ